jgi:RNA polymerase sigma-70 factor (ECF subfamily)
MDLFVAPRQQQSLAQPSVIVLSTAAPAEQATRDEPSDEVLLSRIARQELPALDELYARYGRTAFSVAYHILCNAESAEDVVQDVFMTVWRRAGSYVAGRGSARTWLLSIARHRAIDVARARAARPQGVPIDGMISLAASDDDPATEAMRRIDAANVRAALDCLPIYQRQVVELAFFSGFTYPEISEQIGVPLGTVKSRMRLALDRLRVVLTPAAA